METHTAVKEDLLIELDAGVVVMTVRLLCKSTSFHGALVISNANTLINLTTGL